MKKQFLFVALVAFVALAFSVFAEDKATNRADIDPIYQGRYYLQCSFDGSGENYKYFNGDFLWKVYANSAKAVDGTLLKVKKVVEGTDDDGQHFNFVTFKNSDVGWFVKNVSFQGTDYTMILIYKVDSDGELYMTGKFFFTVNK